MISKAILDTDTLSEIIKARDEVMLQNANDYLDEHGQFTFTSVTVFEVFFGLRAKGASTQIQRFSETVIEHDEITPTAQDYRLSAEICAALQIAGTPIGKFDPLVAACAISRGLPLVTCNIRHHSYIKDAGFNLQLINWRELR